MMKIGSIACEMKNLCRCDSPVIGWKIFSFESNRCNMTENSHWKAKPKCPQPLRQRDVCPHFCFYCTLHSFSKQIFTVTMQQQKTEANHCAVKLVRSSKYLYLFTPRIWKSSAGSHSPAEVGGFFSFCTPVSAPEGSSDSSPASLGLFAARSSVNPVHPANPKTFKYCICHCTGTGSASAQDSEEETEKFSDGTAWTEHPKSDIDALSSETQKHYPQRQFK